MNPRIPAILAASLSLAAFGAVANTGYGSSSKMSGNGPQPDTSFTKAAESTSPVPQVKVATAEKATGADERLADGVTKALNKDSSLKGSKIKVMASNGDITLSGSVKDSTQSAKAESDAKGESKNGKITNNLSASG